MDKEILLKLLDTKVSIFETFSDLGKLKQIQEYHNELVDTIVADASAIIYLGNCILQLQDDIKELKNKTCICTD